MAEACREALVTGARQKRDRERGREERRGSALQMGSPHEVLDAAVVDDRQDAVQAQAAAA